MKSNMCAAWLAETKDLQTVNGLSQEEKSCDSPLFVTRTSSS